AAMKLLPIPLSPLNAPPPLGLWNSELLWRYPPAPPSPLADLKTQLPPQLNTDPRIWGRDEVVVFLRFCEREFDLPKFDLDLFQMNGKALCVLTKNDLAERSPGAGDVLHNVLQMLIRDAQTLHRHLPSSPVTPTGRYPLSPHSHPPTPNWSALAPPDSPFFHSSHLQQFMAASNSVTLSPAPKLPLIATHPPQQSPPLTPISKETQHLGQLQLLDTKTLQYPVSSLLNGSSGNGGSNGGSSREREPSSSSAAATAAAVAAAVLGLKGAASNGGGSSGSSGSGSAPSTPGAFLPVKREFFPDSPEPNTNHNYPLPLFYLPFTINFTLKNIQKPGIYTHPLFFYHHYRTHTHHPTQPKPTNQTHTQTQTNPNTLGFPPHPSRPLTRPVSSGSLSDGRLLWDFLQQLLNDPSQRYSSYIAWKCRDTGVFKIVDPAGLAKLWGKQKNHLSMNYDKMSRALRYYYRVNILRKVQGERHCYQFLRNPTELKSIKNISLLRQTMAASQAAAAAAAAQSNGNGGGGASERNGDRGASSVVGNGSASNGGSSNNPLMSLLPNGANIHHLAAAAAAAAASQNGPLSPSSSSPSSSPSALHHHHHHLQQQHQAAAAAAAAAAAIHSHHLAVQNGAAGGAGGGPHQRNIKMETDLDDLKPTDLSTNDRKFSYGSPVNGTDCYP
ncbi:AGAP009350-PA, partial [Anopheles gambiae str. PEST]